MAMANSMVGQSRKTMQGLELRELLLYTMHGIDSYKSFTGPAHEQGSSYAAERVQEAADPRLAVCISCSSQNTPGVI